MFIETVEAKLAKDFGGVRGYISWLGITDAQVDAYRGTMLEAHNKSANANTQWRTRNYLWVRLICSAAVPPTLRLPPAPALYPKTSCLVST